MSTNTTNVLSSGIEIIGSITFNNPMHIDGKVEGEIFSEGGTVTIGELADIKGDIKAGEVNIYGHVDGNVSSSRCHLNERAVVNGDITTAVLSMVEGARLSGRAQIG
jgi:cytoskeletal protein CcmA (bactofilin family)